MARYIDADEFFDGFCIFAIGQDKNFIKAVETVLEDTPTADVVEVKHGEWIEDPECKYGGDYICSICGNYANESSGGLNDILTNYCSNCGANMDAERKEGGSENDG